MSKPVKQDWLAWIDVAGGSGSWARGPERQDTVRRCLRIFRSDWGSLFDLGGAEITVNVVEVTGHDRVTFGPQGCFAGDYPVAGHPENEANRVASPIEHVSHIYPGRPGKRRA